ISARAACSTASRRCSSKPATRPPPAVTSKRRSSARSATAPGVSAPGVFCPCAAAYGLSLRAMAPVEPTQAAIALGGARLIADASGALAWPGRRTVIIADLHLEKGSSFARHGALLPPYDTRASLMRLEAVLRDHHAETVICLGDSFHDGTAGE